MPFSCRILIRATGRRRKNPRALPHRSSNCILCVDLSLIRPVDWVTESDKTSSWGLVPKPFQQNRGPLTRWDIAPKDDYEEKWSEKYLQQAASLQDDKENDDDKDDKDSNPMNPMMAMMMNPMMQMMMNPMMAGMNPMMMGGARPMMMPGCGCGCGGCGCGCCGCGGCPGCGGCGMGQTAQSSTSSDPAPGTSPAAENGAAAAPGAPGSTPSGCPGNGKGNVRLRVYGCCFRLAIFYIYSTVH